MRNLIIWARRLGSFMQQVKLAVSSLMLLVIVVSMSLDAIARYFFRHSIPWASPVCSLLMVWLAFVTSSIAFWEDAHQSFGFVTERLPAWVQRVLRAAGDLLILLVLILMLKSGLRLQSMQRLQVLPGLQISRRWLAVAVVTGAVPMIFTAIYDLLKTMVLRTVHIDQQAKERG